MAAISQALIAVDSKITLKLILSANLIVNLL
jgi:hypothetical protein